MTKEEARSHFHLARQVLTDAECADLNERLTQIFFASMDLSFVHKIHVFLPMDGRREPDTWPIVERVKREFPHIRLIVPKAKGNGVLEHYYFEGLHQLKNNVWGIPEPTQGVPAEINKIDMVLVPLLAFDEKGHRVGYGKGYYDRFLKQVRRDCKKIGLSMFPPIDRIEDADKLDVAMTGCVTPDGYFEF